MRSTLITLCLSLAFLSGIAQQQSVPESRWDFGFNLGANHSNISADLGSNSESEISNGIGFRLGILANYKLTNSLSFAPKAELSFNSGRINLASQQQEPVIYEVMPISTEFMTHLVLKKPHDTTSPYLLIGPKISIPVGSTTETDEFGTGYDFALDIGVGFEQSLAAFKLSPELRYSWGFRNINENPAIQSVYVHNISLVLNFLD